MSVAPAPLPTPAASRRRRLLTSLGLVLLLTVAALLAAALIPGSHSAGGEEGRARAAVAPLDGGHDRVSAHAVFDSRISARRYGALTAAYDQGITRSGQLLSQNAPVSPSQFGRPFAEYRAYAERWAGHLTAASGALTAALRAGGRGRARAAWAVAFSDYLHLGAVYGFLPGDLNDALAEVPPSTGDRHFPGLHRIEQGLWTGQSTASLVARSEAVQRASRRLQRILPHLIETPLDYSLRAHEILEDAARDLMSGLDVPWSGEGVLGTEAALTADEKEISTLAPLLAGRGNTLGDADYWLHRLGGVLRAVHRTHHGWPTLGQLTLAQRERIDGTIAGTLSVTEDIPDALDTYVPSIPALPGSRSTHPAGGSR